MVPHLPAAILVFFDRPYPDRQEQVALAFATARDLDIVSLCPSVDAALALVLTHHVLVVVSALPPRDGGAIQRAGGTLHVVREDRDDRKRRSVAALIGRLADAGLNVQKIAAALQVDSAEVSRLLCGRRRSGRKESSE